MTEQEKYQREIDDIAIHLMGYGYFRDRAEMIAQDIHPYITEKMEEVRKETAKKFLNELMSRVDSIDTAYGELCYAVETKDIIYIAEYIFGLSNWRDVDD